MTFLQIVGAFFVALFASVGASFIGYCTWIGLCQVWTQLKGSRRDFGLPSPRPAPDRHLGAVGGE